MLCASACLAIALLAADTGTAPAAVPLAFAAPPARWESAPLPAFPPAAGALVLALPDSTPRPQAVEYSDAYFTRLTIHRYASYAIVPMFVAQYVAGEQLMDKGDDAPGWAKDAHGALAGGVAGLFAVNTVTGVWNLWEGRRDPEGRTRRTLHGGLMLLADAGFAATGALANGGDRDLHRAVALSSMGVSLLSYAIMLPIFGNR
ncbi:MAG: hypothetical protein ABW277_16160 [Longimicrobiaceae bacterium]